MIDELKKLDKLNLPTIPQKIEDKLKKDKRAKRALKIKKLVDAYKQNPSVNRIKLINKCNKQLKKLQHSGCSYTYKFWLEIAKTKNVRDVLLSNDHRLNTYKDHFPLTLKEINK